MPPKQASTNEETGSVPVSDLKTVLYAISTANEYSLNTSALAGALGMSGPKNVPRKLRGIIEPHGFELKDNRIMVKGEGNGNPDISGGSSAPVTPAKAKKGAAKTSKKRKLSSDDQPAEEPTGEAEKKNAVAEEDEAYMDDV